MQSAGPISGSRTRFRARAAAAALLAGTWALPAAASAQERGFFLGVALPWNSLSATLDKTVDNSDPETLAPPPRAGEVYQQSDSAGGFGFGFGVSSGYRVVLPGGSFFLDAEVELEVPDDGVRGRLEGVGTSTDRNELGELWPDAWQLDRNYRYGVLLRLGGSPAPLWHHDIALYLVAGLHRTAAEVIGRYSGCLDPTPCNGEGLTSGTDTRDVTLAGWSLGAGLEKTVIGRLAVAAEARYANSGEASWAADFSDVKITVPTTISAEGLSVLLRVLLRF